MFVSNPHGRIPLRQALPGMLALIPVLFMATACSTSGSRGMVVIDSANQDSRVNVLVIHHTSEDFGGSLNILTQPSSYPVSSHYLIPEPGDPTYGKSKLRVYQLVDENRRAWHAGVSHWGGKDGINDQSIGIELVNQTWCHASDESKDPETGYPERICFYPDFDDGQLALLTELLGDILERHPDITPTHIVGHSDVAPDRKIDPGPRFPWERLAKLGYGAWFDDETVIRYWERFLKEPLPLVNIQNALATYGYGIEPTGEDDEQTRNVLRETAARLPEVAALQGQIAQIAEDDAYLPLVVSLTSAGERYSVVFFGLIQVSQYCQVPSQVITYYTEHTLCQLARPTQPLKLIQNQHHVPRIEVVSTVHHALELR